MAQDRWLPTDNHVHTRFSWDTSETAHHDQGLRARRRRGAAGGRVHRTPRLHRLARRGPRHRRRPDRPASRPADADRRRGLLRRRSRSAATASRTCGSCPASRPASRTCSRPASPATCGRRRSTGCSARCTRCPTRAGWSASPGCCGRTRPATMRRYLAELVDMIESSDVFQVLAHCDFPRRYWPGGTHQYARRTSRRSTARCSGRWPRTGRALEINTSSPLASVDQVRWFHEEGGEAVSFGSDAHQPARVGEQFDLAVDVVEAAGFRPGTRPLRLLAPLSPRGSLRPRVLHR